MPALPSLSITWSSHSNVNAPSTEGYDVDALITRRLAAMRLQNAGLDKARAALRNVVVEVARG